MHFFVNFFLTYEKLFFCFSAQTSVLDGWMSLQDARKKFLDVRNFFVRTKTNFWTYEKHFGRTKIFGRTKNKIWTCEKNLDVLKIYYSYVQFFFVKNFFRTSKNIWSYLWDWWIWHLWLPWHSSGHPESIVRKNF